MLYERYAGQTYTIGGEDLVLVRERDILGILSGTDRKTPQLPASTSSQETTAMVKKDQEKEKKKAPAKKAGGKK